MGFSAGPPPSPGSHKKKIPEIDLTTLEGRLSRLAGLKANVQDERFRIINDCVLNPMLVDLTNQSGLIHSTHVGYGGDQFNRYVRTVELYRKRPNTHTILNWWARFFCDTQQVLSITNTGQLWCITYSVPQYYMTAETIKDFYYEKLRAAFGRMDMVIVKEE